MNNSIYITVRLDIEYDNMLEWNDVKNEVISETNYDFSRLVRDCCDLHGL